jgi:hypothetical protein
VRLGQGAFAEEEVARLRAWGAKISQATSPVRDFDIAIEWLRAGKVNPALVQECERCRSRVWRRRRLLLRPVPAHITARLTRPGGGNKAEAVIARRRRKLETRYREQLRRDLPRFFHLGEQDRHDFRRVVRWWRYLRELTLPKRKLPKDALLTALLDAQEALGGIQNLTLVEAAFRKLTPSAELGELRTLLTRQRQAQGESARQALNALKLRLG